MFFLKHPSEEFSWEKILLTRVLLKFLIQVVMCCSSIDSSWVIIVRNKCLLKVELMIWHKNLLFLVIWQISSVMHNELITIFILLFKSLKVQCTTQIKVSGFRKHWMNIFHEMLCAAYNVKIKKNQLYCPLLDKEYCEMQKIYKDVFWTVTINHTTRQSDKEYPMAFSCNWYTEITLYNVVVVIFCVFNLCNNDKNLFYWKS
jgi:hypothetical protein